MPDAIVSIARVEAVQHVRRMRGGAQSHLMRCSDHNFYVVKFRNNPQHLRVLANEMLAGLLARHVGLPVPEPTLVDVSQWLVNHTPELQIELVEINTPCQSGLQFGSRHIGGVALDFLPNEMLATVTNLKTFSGMLAMDKWTYNPDSRQAVFSRRAGQRRYTAAFIDSGFCFNGGEWNFPDHPLHGVYFRNEVYTNVQGWDSFEPWLSRIEGLSYRIVSEAANEIPPEWYDHDTVALDHLVGMLLERRSQIRDLVAKFRTSIRQPFPNWRDTRTIPAA
jgi:hypothetical protein